MRLIRGLLAYSVTLLSLTAGVPAIAQDGTQLSAERAAQEFTNPVSKFPFFIVENDLFLVDGDVSDKDRVANVTVIEPVIPVPLGESGFTLINRPILPIVGTVDIPVGGASTVPSSQPGSTGAGGIGFDDKSGLSDLTFFSLLTPPNEDQGFIYGFGLTSKWPTATEEELGSEKFSVGPAAIALYTTPQFTVGVLGQHWWSYAGDEDRSDVDLTNIQYFYSVALNEQWSIAGGPIISIDWEAQNDDRYSVPVGIGVARALEVFGRPARFLAEVDYYVVQQDTYGPEWNFRAVLGIMLPPL